MFNGSFKFLINILNSSDPKSVLDDLELIEKFIF